MAEDASLTVDEAIRQYARFFFGADVEEVWSKALAGLEANWRGIPGVNNSAIPGVHRVAYIALRVCCAAVCMPTHVYCCRRRMICSHLVAAIAAAKS